MGLVEERLARFGSKPGLERIRRIMKELGDPQKKVKTILVGGTNGKGSVTAYISSILKEEKYRVGSFFSPPLCSENERYQINGKSIGNFTLGKYERKMISLHEQGVEMTKYEAMTAIAFDYFSEQQVDFAVIEVMMGGTYDATNIAENKMSVITNVSLDHTKWLGKTVKQIAEDKAGIIKKGTCVTGAKGKALEAIVKKKGRKKLKVLGEDFSYSLKECNEKRTVFHYRNEKKYENMKVRLAGRYQAENASLAVAICEDLGVSEKIMKRGLRNTKHKGRMQLISYRPRVVIDSAHNPGAFHALSENVDLYTHKNMYTVFSAKQDKNWKRMLEIIAPKTKGIFVCDIKKQGVPAEEIAEFSKKLVKTEVISDPAKAYSSAVKTAGKDDMVVVCGSIYLLRELIDAGKISI